MKYTLLLFGIIFTSCYQVKRTVTFVEDKYLDGKVRKITQTIIRTNKEMELHENFKEVTFIVKEYYQSGKLKFTTKHVHHSGVDYACREALYELSQYDSTGIKRLYIRNECDCHKELEITYNADGKILTRYKKLVKRLY